MKMELEKYLLKKMLKVVRWIGVLFVLLVLPCIVVKGILNINDETPYSELYFLVAYLFEFVLVLFIVHYRDAKKYMRENNVSAETAWKITGRSGDENA